MATPNQTKVAAPFAALPGETALDTVTSTLGSVTVALTVTVTGTVANVQADYATLAAINFASPGAQLTWDDAG